MGFVSIASTPAIDWALQYSWPTFRADDINVFEGRTTFNVRYPLFTGARYPDSANASNINSWGPNDHATGAGTTHEMRILEGVPHHFTNIVNAGSDRYIGLISGYSFPLVPSMLPASFNSGFRLTNLYRAMLLRVGFRMTEGTLNAQDGLGLGMLQYTGQNTGSGQWFNQAIVNQPGGVGIVGDGAGGIQYRSYSRGVALPGAILETIAIPSSVAAYDEWNLAEFALVNGRPGVAASLSTWVNGTLIKEAVFGSADIETPVLPAMGFNIGWSNNADVSLSDGQQLRFGPLEVFQGRFTRDGQELT